MDLGAFLKPGVIYSITLAKVEAIGHSQTDGNEEVKGRLICRRGRPLWLLEAPQKLGATLVASIELPGYDLTADGSLKSAAQESSAPVCLLVKVLGCRPLQLSAKDFKVSHLVRLVILGRLL